MSSEMSSAVKMHVVQSPSIIPKSRGSVASSANSSSDAPIVFNSDVGKALPNSGETLPVLQASKPVASPVPVAPDTDKDKENHKQDVMAAVRNLEDIAQNTRRELKFSVDDDTEKLVIRVLDSESKKVIRQIPAEEVLERAKHEASNDDSKGQLIQLKV